MPEKKFELGDYVEVKDRIRILYELFPQARIETDYHLTAEPDGKPKVISRALVYRKPDDERPAAHGTSWLYLPGKTPYTNGSEIENAETSAVGRAIGMLGILIAGGLASKQEIDNKAGADLHKSAGGFVQTADHPIPDRRPAVPGTLTDNSRAMSPYDGLIGKIELAKDSPEFLPHVGPDGAVLTFKLVSPAGGIKVIATGSLAEVLATVRDETVGVRATCWGRVRDETFTPKGTRKVQTYQVLDLERIKTPSYELPTAEGASPFYIDNASPDPTEALPPPIFDESDLAALDNELAGEGLGLGAA